jgi:hypothetical protein
VNIRTLDAYAIAGIVLLALDHYLAGGTCIVIAAAIWRVL